MNMIQEPGAAVEVFYSYSHKDEKLKEKLDIHLATLKHQGVITEWHDRMIEAGEEWQGKIDEHLDTARIILLLVSADFLASDYCYKVEVKRAIERHEAGTARVISVILKPCDWHGTPFGKLQALPGDSKPVTTWKNRDEAFTDIVLSIKAVVAHIPRVSLQEAVELTPPKPRSNLNRQHKRIASTIAITGSAHLSSNRAKSRIQNIISPYLDPHTIWYCASFGTADEIAAEYLLQEKQQVIVIGFNSLRVTDHMRVLLETYQVPFVDAQQEPVPNIPGNYSNRDILLYMKSDLVIIIWDGQSKHMYFFLKWLREQRKDHLIVFA